MKDNAEVEINGVRLSVPPEIFNIWCGHRQVNNLDTESFGVLIGNHEALTNKYTLVHVTEPMKEDLSKRTFFTMKDPQHQKKVDEYFSRSNGEDIYLGTWHTHPESIPSPSLLDFKDWKECIERNKDRQLFFIIVGIDSALFYVSDGQEFNFSRMVLQEWI